MSGLNVLPALWAKWFFDNIAGKTIRGGSRDSAYAEAILVLSKVCLATARKYRIGAGCLLVPDFDIVKTDVELMYPFKLYLIKNGRHEVTDVSITGDVLRICADGFESEYDFKDNVYDGTTLESEYELFKEIYGVKPVLRNKMRFRLEYNDEWIE